MAKQQAIHVRFAAGVAVMLICLSMGSLVVFAMIVPGRRMRS